MNYLNKLITNMKIFTYNLIYTEPQNNKFSKKYDNICDYDNSSPQVMKMTDEEFKKYRLNTLIYIKQCKNTYYKYTQNELFNQKLYDSYKEDNNFDSGETGFDDDDNISIFDRYILEYIKNRNEIMTYFQCKNIKINMKTKLEELRDFRDQQNDKDILFVIDMTDKQIFDYCIEVQKKFTINETKMITLSFIFKYDNEYIRIKLNSQKMNVEYHPRIVLENFVK